MGQYGSVESNYVIQHRVEQSKDWDGSSVFAFKAPDAGHFGSVRRGIDTRTQEVRAIKHIEKSNPNIKDKVRQEIQVMEAASGCHPNIVLFYEHFEEWNHFDLVFEFCGNGTIADGIQKNRIAQSDAACFCHQMLSALSFLKTKCVLHRDIKPANVLLKDDRTCKLGDFGSACFLNGYEALFFIGGTPAFWPPEVDILPKGEGYSFPFDVWTVGVTLYMMLFNGVHPFLDNGHMNQRQLRRGNFDAGLSWVWNGSQYAFLRWLIMPCPHQRALPENACNHTWLASFGLGSGSFSEEPPTKLVPDNYGRWGTEKMF